MPLSPEFVFNQIDEQRVENTIATLRRMRGSSRVVADPATILLHGEMLSSAAASYIVSRLSWSETNEQLQLWEGRLRELSEVYTPHQAVTVYRNGPLLRDGTQVVRAKLRFMWDNTPENMRWVFLNDNKIDCEFSELYNDNIGILAPFSTDLLVASLLPEFIHQYHSAEAPTVKPVLLDASLRLVALPKNENGRGVFENMHTVLTMVDMGAKGATRGKLLRIANSEYPGKTIQ